MKCYYHNDREATAMCRRCGKGLCTECASKHTPCMCDDCFTAVRIEESERAVALEEERIESINQDITANQDEWRRYIVTGILFGFLIMFMVVMPIPGEYSFTAQQMIADIPRAILGFVIGFFARFGWKAMGVLQQKWNIVVLANPFAMFLWLALKLELSMIIGLPSFIWIWYKSRSVLNELNRSI